MRWDTLLVLAGFLQPVLLVVLVPRRWLGRAMAIWLALPLPIAIFVVLQDLATGPAVPNAGEKAIFAFGLILTTIGAAWVVGSGVAFLVGLGLRRLLRPGDGPVQKPGAAPSQPPRPGSLPPMPAVPGPPPSGAVLEARDAPDGRIRVGIASVEWASTHWVHAPRVEDRATGAMLLDLWGTDWDARVEFPGPAQVRLGLRRYRGPGAWTLLLDAGSGAATLQDATLRSATPETMPIAAAAGRLERASHAAMAAALPVVAPPPHPFTAWRTALVILVLACGAIAALTWATLPEKRPQVLDKLPAFPPGATR